LTSRDELASKYFKCTKRERAAFEAGIKLGTIYHQFVGTPISSSNVESLERAIEDGVRVQPFVEEVSVRIDRKGLRKKRNEYDYQTLTGQMLEVSVVIRIDEVKVIAEMKYIEELNYPLMFIKEIIETL
jgi:hypothetical protein